MNPWNFAAERTMAGNVTSTEAVTQSHERVR